MALAAAVALAPLAAAQAQIEPRLDRNGDGFMDESEAQQAALEKFTALDADRDGSLSPPELNLQPRAANPLDTDSDRVVSLEEYWLYFSGFFLTADADRDDRLSAAELATMRERQPAD